jgi:hypothetical protein
MPSQEEGAGPCRRHVHVMIWYDRGTDGSYPASLQQLEERRILIQLW